VLLQFLVEAVVLSAAGGLIGIALGIAGAATLASTMGWPFVISPLWISVAFGISMAIGVAFGYYPARKAARMNPQRFHDHRKSMASSLRASIPRGGGGGEASGDAFSLMNDPHSTQHHHRLARVVG
jgi:membrane-bound ClpP family serine protease